MRRVAAALGATLAVTLAALALTSAATSGPAAQQTRVGCGVRALTLLFWPQGHPAIASVRFPEFLVPHLEIYRTGAAYPGPNFYGFMGADGTFNLRPTCKTLAAPLIRARVKPAKVQRDTTALVCALAKAAHLDVVKTATGTRLLVIVPPATMVAVANVKMSGSTLTYNSKLCRPTPPPA